MSGDHEALLEFVEAVEEDCGGIWVEEVDDSVLICLLGLANMPALGEAYIVACRALNRPMLAVLAGETDPMPTEQAEKMADLPRYK